MLLRIGNNVIEKAVIYSNGSQECERISMLIKNLGGEFHEYLVDVDFSERQFEMEFGKDADYPQVSIGNRHIGSIKETLQFLKNQKLI